MATVHIGRLLGPVGFHRTVAIKRLHAQFARDPEFVSMFLDEARLAAKIRHPNVVSTLDVVATADELFVVMDYVQGESLGRLWRAMREHGAKAPTPIVSAILAQVLQGLHAAHEAVDDSGRPLGIIHRDVSPQNVIVGVDGVTRVLDFGVAKASSRLHETRSGEIKGKLSYMAPEQIDIRGGSLTRAVDIYASGIILWEMLTGRRLYKAETEAETMFLVLRSEPPSPRSVEPTVSSELEAVTMRALHRDPKQRFATAEDMAAALAEAGPTAIQLEIGRWVRSMGRDGLEHRAARIAEIERNTTSGKHDVADFIGRLGASSEDDVDVSFESVKPPPLNSMIAPVGANDSRDASVPGPDGVAPLQQGRRFGLVAGALLGAMIAIVALAVLAFRTGSSATPTATEATPVQPTISAIGSAVQPAASPPPPPGMSAPATSEPSLAAAPSAAAPPLASPTRHPLPTPVKPAPPKPVPNVYDHL
jgi:serine/threonine-protein kinase